MEYEKLITPMALSLFSIFAGWFLAQSTGLFKDWRHKKNILKCLSEELSELDLELTRTLIIFSRQLQIHALQGIGDGAPICISNHIFKNYYKDAVIHLNSNQRISIQMIYALIDEVNKGISVYRVLTGDLQKKAMLEGTESITSQEGELWGKTVIGEFKNITAALWHIDFHKRNKENPDLSAYTKNHENYLIYMDKVNKEVIKIMDSAKNLDREQFNKTYDPIIFANQFIK